MDMFQVLIPLECKISTYQPYCSINEHKWTFFKFSPHQNPLNYQNIIRTAAYMDINEHVSSVHCSPHKNILNYQHITHTAT
jgi:hypothetical protein